MFEKNAQNFLQKMCRIYFPKCAKKEKEVEVANLSFYCLFQKITLTKKWVPHVQILKSICKNFCNSDHVKRPLEKELIKLYKYLSVDLKKNKSNCIYESMTLML